MLLDVMEKILLLAVSGLDPDDSVSELLSVLLKCCEELTKKVEVKTLVPYVTSLSKLLAMVSSYFGLAAVDQEGSARSIGLEPLDDLLALQRACLQVQVSMDSLPTSLPVYAQEIAKCKQKCDKRVEKIKAMLLEYCKTNLDASFKALRDLHSTMSDQYWLEEFKGTTMEDWKAYVGDTALKVDAEELLRLTQQLQKAGHC